MYEDLISALRECSKQGKRYGMAVIYMEKAADAIEQLQQTAEHYKGCADDWYKEACDYKAAVPKWIPVMERLPDVFERVITYDKTHGVVLNHRCADNMSWWIGFHITHWMPLPEPPKEEA